MAETTRPREHTDWHVVKQNSEKCMICVDYYNNEDQIILKCCHTFHEKCFSEYEKTLTQYQYLLCPTCRTKITKLNPSSSTFLAPNVPLPLAIFDNVLPFYEPDLPLLEEPEQNMSEEDVMQTLGPVLPNIAMEALSNSNPVNIFLPGQTNKTDKGKKHFPHHNKSSIKF